MRFLPVVGFICATITTTTSQENAHDATIVHPEVFEGREEDSEKYLSIHEGYAIRLKRVSVLAPSVLVQDATEDGTIERQVPGYFYEKHLYTDAENQASLLIKPQGTEGYEITGLLNFTHQIRPFRSEERSLSGKIAHRISKITFEDGTFGVADIAGGLHAEARTAGMRKPMKASGHAPSNFTLELFVVSDVEYTRQFSSEKEHFNYLVVLTLSVSLRLLQLRPPGSIAVTGLLRIANEQDEKSYVSLRNPFEIFGRQTMWKLTHLPKRNEKMFSADGILLFTSRRIVGKDSQGSTSEFLGKAHVGGACSSPLKSLVVKDTPKTFSGTLASAHEIGHFLGAPHDGEGKSSMCKPADGFLMNPKGIGAQLHKFSVCSIRAIKDFLRSENSSCLKSETNNHDTFLPNGTLKTGGVIDGENYCNAYFPQYKVSLKEAKDNCQFRCDIQGSKSGPRTVDIFAPDGASCDLKNLQKKCFYGFCM